MKHTLIIFTLALCSLSCNKEFELINPLDADQPLLAPTHLRVETMTEQNAEIKFVDPNYNPKFPNSRVQFVLERNSGGGFVAIQPAFTFSDSLVIFTDSSLFLNSVAYTYRVFARRGETISTQTQTTKHFSFPSPGNLSVQMQIETVAKLTWTNTYTLSTKVLIEKSTNATTGYVLVDSASATLTTKDVIGVYSSDTTYYFRIRYVSNINQSAYTTPVSQKLGFFAPTNLQIISMTTTQVNLSWSDNSTFETSFEIEQSNNNTTFNIVQTVNANITNTTISGIFDSTTRYYFRVRAKSQYNISAFSNTQSYNIAAEVATATGLILVEGGTFTMGSPQGVGDSNESPLHSVTLSDFYIGRFEVTQKRWRDVVQWKQGSATSPLNPNPSYFSGDSLLWSK